MKLVVGLGNPGKEYEFTRHNVGFMILDRYVGSDGWQKKFEGLYKVINIGQEKVIFLKPQTFMNLSGNSVIKVIKYYDIALEDILVIQDDMDLDFGRFKVKYKSSSGGHNGIKSIINVLHSQDFSRLKIGISHDENKDTISYVLGKFSKDEQQYFEKNYDVYFQIIESFVSDGVEKTMNKFNA